MLKKLLTNLFAVFAFITTVSGQTGSVISGIGIQTESPLGVFHIDSKSNNDLNDPTTFNDDFIVTPEGNVGIGTTTPEHKLSISSAWGQGFKFTDGSQKAGKILTSIDNQGTVGWLEPGTSVAYIGDYETPNGASDDYIANLISNGVATPQESDNVAYTGMYIDLPEGTYQVNFTIWCAPYGSVNAALASGNNGAGLRFASVFLSADNNTVKAVEYITAIKSVIINPLYQPDSKMPDYYGGGGIPIRVLPRTDGQSTTRFYVWMYMSGGNYSATNRQLRTRTQSPGNYGPYTQLYAIPFYVSDDNNSNQTP